jgi:hypothetical protein
VIGLKLLGGAGVSLPRSFVLQPGSTKQSFQLELLYPEAVSMPVGEDGEAVDMLRFRSSGRMLPHCSAAKVVRKVPGSSLHPLKDTVYATMNAEDAISFRMDSTAGGLKPWATLEHLTGARELERDLQLPDNTVCFNCHEGWADEALGPLLQCKGGCNRAFHTACHANFPLDTQICGRCSGHDTDICAICDHEWSDPSKNSDYYTGEMVACDGGCECWFHQMCHSPCISDAQVKSKKKWKCADCVSGRPAAARPTSLPTPAAMAVPALARSSSSTQALNSSTSTALPAANVVSSTALEAATAKAPTIPASAAIAPPAHPLNMEVIEQVLIRGQRGYGFSLSAANQVDRVYEGGSAAVAGLHMDDLVVAVNGRRLAAGEAMSLEGRQCEGTRLTLTCHRKRSLAADEADNASKRRRTAVQQPGMRSYQGVRIADASRTHAQRMADRFESGTADCL